MKSGEEQKLIQDLINNKDSFFQYFKAKYPVFNNSNVFLRDFQYGIKRYFEKKDIKINYTQTQNIAEEYGKYLENDKTFERVNSNGWKLYYPDFSAAIPFPKENTPAA